MEAMAREEVLAIQATLKMAVVVNIKMKMPVLDREANTLIPSSKSILKPHLNSMKA